MAVAERTAEMAPVEMLGGDTPEQKEALFLGGMGLGLAGDAIHGAPDIVGNELGDKLFITDNNYGDKSPPKPPTPYGTDSIWISCTPTRLTPLTQQLGNRCSIMLSRT
jgi:hypothetical protein